MSAFELMSATRDSTPPQPTQRDLFGWFAAILFFMILLALVTVMFGPMMPAGLEFSIDRATFVVMNAITLTGFQMSIASIDQYRPAGQVLVFLLTFVSAVFWLTAGGTAGVRILRIPVSDAGVFVHSLCWTVICTAIGTAVLSAGDRSAPQAAFLALSSFSNSGLALGSIPGSTHWQLWIAVLPLAMLGALGLPVLIEFWLRIRSSRALSNYSWTVLRLMAVVFVVGLALQVFAQLLSGGTNMKDATGFAATAVNSRSLGLPLDTSVYSVRSLSWIVMLLMLIGGGSASCAGGLKVTTLMEIARAVLDSLAGRPVRAIFGAAAITAASILLLVGVCFLALLTTQPQLASDRLLFLSVSAATGTGLAQDPISIVGSGLFVLSNTMLLGKLVPLMILWWLATRTPRSDTLVA